MSGVGDAGNHPFSVLTDEIEEICSAVIDLAVDQKVERGPDYGEVVVDAHQRIVYALFDVRSAGSADPFGEGVEGHLGGLAVAHEDHGAAGQSWFFDSCGAAFRHAVKHCLYGSKDGLLFRCRSVERGREEAGECCAGKKQMQMELTRNLHGSRF